MVRRKNPGLWALVKGTIERLATAERDYSDKVVDDGGKAIHPKSALAFSVTLISGLCLFYTMIVVPFNLAYYWTVEICEGVPTKDSDLVIESFFMFEIFFTFFVGRYSRGLLISTFSGVAKDYCWSGQLLFDCATSIPVSWIEYASRQRNCNGSELVGDVNTSSSQALSVLRVLKPLRLIRLLRMLKLMNHRMFRAIEEELQINPDVVRLFKLMAGTIIVSHFSGCLFWFVKTSSNTPQELRDWMDGYTFFGGKWWWCDYAAEPDCPVTPELKVDVWVVYSCCFYFSMTTLTTAGYGDIAGTNVAEQIFCAVLQLCGTVVFAAIMSQLGAVISNMTARARALENEMEVTRKFMVRENMDSNVSKRCAEWMRFRENIMINTSQMESILRKLPHCLRERVVLLMYQPLLQSLPVFHNSGTDFLAKVAGCLTRYLFSESEHVISQGNWNDTLFIVLGGFLQVTDRKGNKLFVLDQGDRFGESDVLRPRIQKISVLCLSFSELLGISNQVLEDCARDFPHVQKRFRSMAREIDPEAINISTLTAMGGYEHDTETLSCVADDGEWDRAKEDTSQLVTLRWGAAVDRLLRADAAKDVSLRLRNRLIQFSYATFGAHQLSSSSSEDEELQAPQGNAGWETSESEKILSGETPRETFVSDTEPQTESATHTHGQQRVLVSDAGRDSEPHAQERGGDGVHHHDQGLTDRVLLLDRRVCKVDRRLSELQRSMDDVLYVLARQRLGSVRSSKMQRSSDRSAPATQARSDRVNDCSVSRQSGRLADLDKQLAVAQPLPPAFHKRDPELLAVQRAGSGGRGAARETRRAQRNVALDFRALNSSSPLGGAGGARSARADPWLMGRMGGFMGMGAAGAGTQSGTLQSTRSLSAETQTTLRSDSKLPVRSPARARAGRPREGRAKIRQDLPDPGPAGSQVSRTRCNGVDLSAAFVQDLGLDPIVANLELEKERERGSEPMNPHLRQHP